MLHFLTVYTMSICRLRPLDAVLSRSGLDVYNAHCQCAPSVTSVTAHARWLPLAVADGNSTRLGWTEATIELASGQFPV